MTKEWRNTSTTFFVTANKNDESVAKQTDTLIMIYDLKARPSQSASTAVQP